MASKTNFTSNGQNYFRIRKTLGRNAAGKPIQKAFYGNSKKEAEQAYEEWKEKQKQSGRSKSSSFAQIARMYAEEVLPNSSYAPGTIERYYGVYKNYVACDDILGCITISELTPYDIQTFLNRVRASTSTKNACRKFLSAMLKFCALCGYCNVNISVVTLPQEYKQDEVIVWTDEELQYILHNLLTYRGGHYRLRFFISLAAMTGMRVSEILGLKYSDISGGVINVKRQYYRGVFKTPKANSVRQLPLPPVLEKELEVHKEWHLKENPDAEYIFTTQSGKMLDYHNVRLSLKRFYNSIGIKYKKTHAYRATFCTLLCRNGVPIQTASKLLGHKSVEITAKYYMDVDMEDKRTAVMSLPIDFR